MFTFNFLKVCAVLRVSALLLSHLSGKKTLNHIPNYSSTRESQFRHEEIFYIILEKNSRYPSWGEDVNHECEVVLIIYSKHYVLLCTYEQSGQLLFFCSCHQNIHGAHLYILSCVNQKVETPAGSGSFCQRLSFVVAEQHWSSFVELYGIDRPEQQGWMVYLPSQILASRYQLYQGTCGTEEGALGHFVGWKLAFDNRQSRCLCSL